MKSPTVTSSQINNITLHAWTAGLTDGAVITLRLTELNTATILGSLLKMKLSLSELKKNRIESQQKERSLKVLS